ncbi:MAG: hypothetical protein HQK87_07800 [Nitrospinae bacterium]|nr:hypothetical protein [Nitrospinota bacterium]
MESDLAAQQSAARLGYDTTLTAVGDKWVLLTALLCQLDEALPADVVALINAEARSPWPSADRIERLMEEAGFDMATAPAGRFTVGAEETGHAITPLFTDRGVLFAGDGLKSCLNTFAATAAMTGDIPEARFYAVTRPFEPGFKKTLYAYYVAKERWRRGNETWDLLRDRMIDEVTRLLPEAIVEEMIRPEDGDMLYLKLMIDGRHAGSLFVRNSGTEDKTGLNLRGVAALQGRLTSLGETLVRELMALMKDRAKPMAAAERRLLALSVEGAPERLDRLGHEEYHHLLMEVGAKQGLLTAPSPGATLTERGRWALSALAATESETR